MCAVLLQRGTPGGYVPGWYIGTDMAQILRTFLKPSSLSVTVTPTLRYHAERAPLGALPSYSAALNGHFSQRSSPSRQLSKQIPASAHSASVGQQIFTHSGFATRGSFRRQTPSISAITA